MASVEQVKHLKNNVNIWNQLLALSNNPDFATTPPEFQDISGDVYYTLAQVIKLYRDEGLAGLLEERTAPGKAPRVVELLSGWHLCQEYPHLNGRHFQSFIDAVSKALDEFGRGELRGRGQSVG